VKPVPEPKASAVQFESYPMLPFFVNAADHLKIGTQFWLRYSSASPREADYDDKPLLRGSQTVHPQKVDSSRYERILNEERLAKGRKLKKHRKGFLTPARFGVISLRETNDRRLKFLAPD
jgi:hypothetical protein